MQIHNLYFSSREARHDFIVQFNTKFDRLHLVSGGHACKNGVYANIVCTSAEYKEYLKEGIKE